MAHKLYKILLVIPAILLACNDVKFDTTPKGSGAGGGDGSGTPEPPGSTPKVPRNITETAVLPNSNAVDILFVVDNSGSMAPEQAKLAQNLAQFTTRITDLDWQIAITTTDMQNSGDGNKGTLKPFDPPHGNKLWITKADENLFAATVNVGDNGDGTEQGIRASYTAILNNQSSWIRPDAILAVVLLSDEDECSDRSGCMSGNHNPQNLLNMVRGKWGARKNLVFNSIVVSELGCLGEQENQLQGTSNQLPGHMGTAYMEASLLTSGIIGSICTDFVQDLSGMGNLVKELKDSIVLQCKPVDGSFSITYQDTGAPVPHELVNDKVFVRATISSPTTLVLKYTCL